MKLIEDRSVWKKVTLRKTTGWVHSSALTTKTIVLQAGKANVKTGASNSELSLAGKGFNAIIVNLVEHKFKGPQNRYGDYPFAGLGGEPAMSPEGLPAHQEKQIRDAAPDKARVVPGKQRRVLIWSTPSHLMDSDPHKGYCVPYGACAMRNLGEKTGAFKPELKMVPVRLPFDPAIAPPSSMINGNPGTGRCKARIPIGWARTA